MRFRMMLLTAGAVLSGACDSPSGPGGLGPLARLAIVSGDAQSAPVLTEVPLELVVSTADAQGRPIPNVTVTFEVVSGGGSVSTPATATGPNGEARTRWTLGSGAGTQQVKATAVDAGGARMEALFSATAVAGPFAALRVLGGDAQTGRVGMALPAELAVVATDASDNPVAGVSVNFEVTEGGGSVAPGSAVGNGAGESRTRWTLGPAAGTAHQVRAFATRGATGAPVEVRFSATAQPGVLSRLVAVSGDAQTGTVGTTLAEELVVRAEDAGGNVIPGLTVTFTVASGGGSVAPASAVTNATGIAATHWTLGTVAASAQRIQAVATDVEGARAEVELTATPTAGTPATLTLVSGDAQAGDPGVPLPQPLRVRVNDVHGNPVAGVTVQWAVQGGGTVTPPTSSTDVEGHAETTWTMSLAPNQTVAATAGGSQVTFSATLKPAGPLETLTIVEGNNQTGAAGTELPLPLGVRATDAHGRPIAGQLVVFEVIAGGGSVFTRTALTAANGETRDRWTLGTSINAAQTVRARAVDPITGTGREVTFTAIPVAGPPATLVIVSGNNQSAAAGTHVPQPLLVRVRDEFNNNVAGAMVTWSVTAGGGSVAPETSTTLTNGQAQTNWKLGPGGTQTVVASIGTLQREFSATAIVAPPGWTSLPALPVGVRSAVATVFNGRIHLLGGFGGGGFTKSHQVYDPATNAWTQRAELPTAMDNAQVAVTSEGLHLLGGSASGGSIRQHWIYNYEANTWTAAPDLPRARRAGHAWAVGGRIYLFGGIGNGVLPQVDVYDVASRTWSTAAPMTEPRFHMGIGFINGEIVLAGGAQGNNQSSSSVSAFNPVSGTWREQAPLPAPRHAHGLFVMNSQICIAGGRNSTGEVAVVVCRAPTASTWEAHGTLPAPRSEVGATVFNDRGYILGGTPGNTLAERFGPIPN